MAPYDTLVALQRLIDHAIPESPTIEYKEALSLVTRKERGELLKDLTGMGNGGGGSVIFGIREGEEGVALEISPLDEAAIIGVVEDVVRAGVRPPLLLTLTRVEVDARRFCLVADIEQSPLGPYMVEAYDHQRYYVRLGTRTLPMSEQQVRDAYTLAARLRDRRAVVWTEHNLPIALPSTEDPWLAVAAVPEEPLREIVDVGEVEPDQLVPPEPIARHLGIYGLNRAVQHLGRWADGYFGDDRYGEDRQPSVMARLHRDGAVGIADQLRRELSAILTARVLNAELLYVAWFWDRIGLRRPVELQARLEQMSRCALDVGSMFGDKEVVREPTGIAIDTLVQSDHLLPGDLLAARHRHRVVQRFTDRVMQAFGLPRALPLFRTGQLYGADGRPVGHSVAGAGVWTHEGQQVGRVFDSGAVMGPDGEVVGHWIDGVFLDTAGDAVGVLELAPGDGCPDDFVATAVLTDPRARVPGGNPGSPLGATSPSERPIPTRRWSTHTVGSLLST